MTYEFDDDPGRIDVEAIWSFLSTEAYWGRWRTRNDLERQLQSAWRVVGGYSDKTGEQVAFARAVSDGVSDAYLADVYVHPDHRGLGLGRRLVTTMIDNGPGATFRWTLFTNDAHELYRTYGFTEPDHTFMTRPPRRD